MDPPLTRNLPPISGKMYWARQLSIHLEKPIEKFKKKKQLLKTGLGCVVVRKYNKLARQLAEYEIKHYNVWVSQVEQSHQMLNVSCPSL